jgi:hypothetical protein
VTLSKRRSSRSVIAASLFFVFAVCSLAAHGWSGQDGADPTAAASVGNVVASVSSPSEGRIGNRVIEALAAR